jgi:hypothetical protein
MISPVVGRIESNGVSFAGVHVRVASNERINVGLAITDASTHANEWQVVPAKSGPGGERLNFDAQEFGGFRASAKGLLRFSYFRGHWTTSVLRRETSSTEIDF